MVMGLRDIYSKFGEFWRSLTSESQLRWVSEGFTGVYIFYSYVAYIYGSGSSNA